MYLLPANSFRHSFLQTSEVSQIGFVDRRERPILHELAGRKSQGRDPLLRGRSTSRGAQLAPLRAQFARLENADWSNDASD